MSFDICLPTTTDKLGGEEKRTPTPIDQSTCGWPGVGRWFELELMPSRTPDSVCPQQDGTVSEPFLDRIPPPPQKRLAPNHGSLTPLSIKMVSPTEADPPRNGTRRTEHPPGGKKSKDASGMTRTGKSTVPSQKQISPPRQTTAVVIQSGDDTMGARPKEDGGIHFYIGRCTALTVRGARWMRDA